MPPGGCDAAHRVCRVDLDRAELRAVMSHHRSGKRGAGGKMQGDIAAIVHIGPLERRFGRHRSQDFIGNRARDSGHRRDDLERAVQVAGLILLVAMIGAIVLTMRTRVGVKRQDISAQIDRKAEDTLVLKKVSSGQGI